ncbi:MAG: DUF5060 domain-containing protein [Bryobacteraceae bacterium]
MRALLVLSALAWPAMAQTVCQPTPTYTPCEVIFELSSEEAAAHPNPYLTVQLEAEFRSPRYRTFRMPGYWDGGRRLVVRFSPTEPGEWVFRVTSNIARFQDKEGTFTATDSKSPGFLKPANVHHWARIDELVKTPHLWMGDTLYALPYLEREAFDKLAAARAEQKFTHLRGVVLAPPEKAANAYLSADRPDTAVFRELDERILALNRKGMVVDLMLAYDQRQLMGLFPDWAQRERYVRYLVARYAAMDITWQGFVNFESAPGGRAALKEIGLALKKLDPYQHPRSTGAQGTSSAMAGDEWMNYLGSQGTADDLAAVEHQLYALPQVAFGPPPATDADSQRHWLWNVTMDGTYPTADTGNEADSPAARQMKVWFEFFSRTRHWELEPYFDVDGGRAVALEGVEYIVYVEKPGPVELVVEKHGYDVAWLNPITGESVKEKKEFKEAKFAGEPPDKLHDWVLHISREGHKEGMLKSYKFESRQIAMQEIEQVPQKMPFEIMEPAADTLSLASPAKYAIRITRETRATRRMMWLWMGDVAADQEGARAIGTGAQGTFAIPQSIADSYPADMALRLYAMNALGKVYSIIRVFKLTP